MTLRSLYEHTAHAQAALRKQPKHAEPETFNERVAEWISVVVGSMRFFWALLLFIVGWMVVLGKLIGDPYPFALMLLIVGGVFQALAMVAIMVSQTQQGKAADDRALHTYLDAEAILAEAVELQKHLQAQDEVLLRLISAADLAPP